MTRVPAITLLTTSECRFCEHAKQMLTRFTREMPFTVEIVDLDTPDGRRLAEQHGVLVAPGILVDGRMVGYGRPSERRLRRELQRACAADTGEVAR